MIEVRCDFCGNKMHKEFVHKVKIEPWFNPACPGHIYKRDFDCCEACASAIEHKLIHIANNYLWRGKDPNKRQNWGTVTGYWKLGCSQEWDTYTCSRCHETYFGEPDENYCPNCGAKMMREQADGTNNANNAN